MRLRDVLLLVQVRLQGHGSHVVLGVNQGAVKVQQGAPRTAHGVLGTAPGCLDTDPTLPLHYYPTFATDTHLYAKRFYSHVKMATWWTKYVWVALTMLDADVDEANGEKVFQAFTEGGC